MKTFKSLFPLVLASLLTCVAAFRMQAQGTALHYQGRLSNGANPANGSYDLTFGLFGVSSGGSAVAGPVTNSATAVSNGLFTVTLDFGNQFPGAARWLEIGVRTNGGGTISTPAPPHPRTEERRVGEEGRRRGWPYD